MAVQSAMSWDENKEKVRNINERSRGNCDFTSTKFIIMRHKRIINSYDSHPKKQNKGCANKTTFAIQSFKSRSLHSTRCPKY